MKQGNFGPRKTILFLLFLSMLTFQPGFARADEWEDAGFTSEAAREWSLEFTNAGDAKKWRDAGFTRGDASWLRSIGYPGPFEVKRWELAGYKPVEAAGLNIFFSTPDEAKKFSAKYCKKGFAENFFLENTPENPNDADGANCYRFGGEIFQVLGDNEGLYQQYGAAVDKVFYISFGKGGRAVSVIDSSIVTVTGSYKYHSTAGLQIVPRLKILTTARKRH